MFKKIHRLKTKDVLFLTKKRIFFGNGFFGFFFVKQYPNIDHSQMSFHVSIKYSKHSNKRNTIKRAVLKQAKKTINTHKQNNWKIFIILNKNKIPALQKEFENKNQKDIISIIQKHFEQSFIALLKHLCKY